MKIGRRLLVVILAAGGLDKLIYTVYMLDPSVIWLLDDKIKLPLFVLAATTDENFDGKHMFLIFFVLKFICFLHNFL